MTPTTLAETILRDVPIRGRMNAGRKCLDELVFKKDVEAAIAALPARGVGVDIEDMARTIYDAMRFDRKDKTPEWVNGGNSHAQVEARAAAARILAALSATTEDGK